MATEEHMRKAEIVLSDALPYELFMLDSAARRTQTTEFQQLKIDASEIDWLTSNATIEAFWTHARCLLEFFNRTKNNNFEASAASARDFTSDDYQPSGEIQAMWGNGRLSETINEQISHVGFCRVAEKYEKLGPELPRVKGAIDRETRALDRSLRREFRQYWTWEARGDFVYAGAVTPSCQFSALRAKIV